MKITIICKSDTTGGAAIASFRLMQALRSIGEDARMLVVEKKSDSPYVEAVGGKKYKFLFLAERLKIFLQNGLSRKTLFQIDTGDFGLPLWKHPLVKNADAVLLQWVNQGMLSLKGIEKISSLDKKVIWTMHDLWPFTGICHHPYSCLRYELECGNCPLLGHNIRGHESPHDLSYKIWRRKEKLYHNAKIKFVAVSSWVKKKAEMSSLLRNQTVTVIPNAFPSASECLARSGDNRRIIFGAARLDDPVKGIETFFDALNLLHDELQEKSGKIEVVLFGAIRNPQLLEDIKFPWKHLGEVKGLENVRQLYQKCDVVVSSSHFETSGNTLVEGQAFGCIPVSFDRGGQKDIISHKSDGFLASWDDDQALRARNLAEGIKWALANSNDDIRKKMLENVLNRFSYKAVAQEYINLIKS